MEKWIYMMFFLDKMFQYLTILGRSKIITLTYVFFLKHCTLAYVSDSFSKKKTYVSDSSIDPILIVF